MLLIRVWSGCTSYLYSLPLAELIWIRVNSYKINKTLKLSYGMFAFGWMYLHTQPFNKTKAFVISASAYRVAVRGKWFILVLICISSLNKRTKYQVLPHDQHLWVLFALLSCGVTVHYVNMSAVHLISDIELSLLLPQTRLQLKSISYIHKYTFLTCMDMHAYSAI